MSLHLLIRKYLLASLLILTVVICQGQEPRQDFTSYALKMDSILASGMHDTLKIEHLLNNILEIDIRSTRLPLHYIDQALEIAEKGKWIWWTGQIYREEGELYSSLNEKDSSALSQELALAKFIEAGDDLASISMHIELTNSYGSNDAADKSLQHGYDALEISKKIGDRELEGDIYSAIAGAMYNFDETEKAVKFTKKKLAIFDSLGLKLKIAACYRDLANYDTNSLDNALDNFSKALSIFGEDPEANKGEIKTTLFGRISINTELENYDAVEKDLEYINTITNGNLRSYDKYYWEYLNAINKINQGEYIESELLFQQIINHPNSKYNPFLSYSYEGLINIYQKLNQYDSAFHYLLKLKDYDTIEKMHESKLNMLALENKYESEKKEVTIAAQNEVISKQKTIQWFALVGTLLLLLLLFQTYRNNIEKRKANEQLIELDTLKTRLYTNITHEFRTPLTVIIGMASQIQSNPSAFLAKGTDMIQRNGNRLLDLINQMLDLSKLESGSMALHQQQGNIIQYLNYLSESIHSYSETKNISVHFYPEVDNILMDYDEEKIKIIFTNLFSNAVKFSPEGGNIYIIAREEVLDKEPMLMIKFKDTGMGIPEAELPFVFDRFYQVDGTVTRGKEGSGIGLSLVREYILLMGGSVTVKSKVGIETEFTILLPITNKAPITKSNFEKPQQIEIQDQKEPKPIDTNIKPAIHSDFSKDKPTLLLVEDNADVVAYIASCLPNEYNFIVGQNGQEGIEIALEYIPDIIITDVMMPIKDGFEVCRTLKSSTATSHIPIIMLTAKADMDSKIEGLEYGADAYLAKPFHKPELLTRIKKLLESRAQLQAHYLALSSVEKSKDFNSAIDIEKATLSSEEIFVNTLNEIVTDHINEPEFTVAQFAQILAMSSTQFHRKVTALTGVSPIKFIRHVRLTKSKTMLNETELPINTVAYNSGFNDPGYFGRVFKKEFGMTPIEWREKNN